MLIKPLAKSASSLSKTGSPRPTGRFETTTSIFAPIESPSFLNLSIRFSISFRTFLSGQKKGLLFISLKSILFILILPI